MHPVLSPVIVGRDGELSRLRAAVEAAFQGRGGVVALLGAPGSGKSRLAGQVAAEAAAAGAAVLTGRAVSSPVPVPFRPLTEALQGGLRTADVLPSVGPYQAALGQVLPPWAPVPAGGEGPARSLAVLGEGVLRLLLALAGGRPLVLVLEDLHWADAETLAVLEYVADNLAGTPVLVLATLRDEDAAGVALLSALEARRRADVLRLGPLAPPDVARMAAECLRREPDEALLRAVVERADGVPLFVEELLAVAAAAGDVASAVPQSFAESVRARLDRLPAAGRRVVECAAVLGRRVDWRWVAEAADAAPREVLDALRAAAAAQLLEPDADGEPGELRFRHALTRDAVLAEVFAPDRAALAAAALQALRARDPELSGDACQRAADLAEEAGRYDDAVDLLLESARRASSAGALETAEALLDRARRLVATGPGARVAVDEALLDVLVTAGRVERVVDVGRVLLARLDPAGDPVRVARCHLLLAQSALDAAEPGPAGEHLAAARRLVPDDCDPELALRLDLVTADAALVAHRLDDAEAAARRAVAAADALGPAPVRGEARLLLGRCQRERDLPVAERTFVAALDLAEGAALPLLRVRALAELGSFDVHEARPPNRLLHAAAEAREAGLMTVAGVAMLHAVIAGYLRHDREGALGHAAELRTLAERYRLGLLVPAAGVLAACVHASYGEQAEMERLLDEHLPGVGDDLRWRANAWGHGWGVLRLGLDDLPGAAEALHRAVETEVPALPSSNPFHSLCVLVDVVAGADDLTHPARAARPVARAPRGLLLAARAVALGREGEPAEAAATQAEALQVLDRLPWFRHVTARLVAECALADGWGTPEVWLRETEAWAGEVGLPRLAEACRGLLRRAGVRVPRSGTAGQVPAALRGLGVTCREADVLALVACGATNRDIAAALYLSPRTVEKHVERLLQKTGCASRTELAVRATRLGTGDSGRVRP